ncbi:MAG: hypothetical protein ACM3SU_04830 [Acidobacteriota bacterium]
MRKKKKPTLTPAQRKRLLALVKKRNALQLQVYNYAKKVGYWKTPPSGCVLGPRPSLGDLASK